MEGPHTRREDPDTSHKAARTLRRTRLSLRDKVLSFAADHADFIDEDLVHAFPDAPESSYRKRRSELTEEGWIVDSGRRRKNGDGNDMIVWVYRSRHPNPPPLIGRRTSGPEPRGPDRTAGLQHAANLEEGARQMRREGRAMWADQLQQAAEYIRSVAA
jgi:hypothetical protein